MKNVKKIMLIYPPGKMYQRGEDRSQGNIFLSAATTMRACNDLGYAASNLKKDGHDVFLRDYQTEGLTRDELIADFRSYHPHYLFTSTTDATIFDDLQILSQLNQIYPKCKIILKGALFFDLDQQILNSLPLSGIDYLIGGESDFIIARLIKADQCKEKLSSVPGIIYKENKQWHKTEFKWWEENLDSLDFPDREQMNNRLYIRPDTGEPIATISASRGCSYNCIFCLTPRISGTRIRFRSISNIIDEINSCYHRHGIKNFFFKADTFTLDKNWVGQLCAELIKTGLSDKIQWAANSRTNPLDFETLDLMHSAGCWLVAYGFESGSPETLTRIEKQISIADNLRAAQMTTEAGMEIYGFFVIGFPWEDYRHLADTENHIYQLNSDFIEIHIANPYYGTKLYQIAQQENVLEGNILGGDYFSPTIKGTKYLSLKALKNFRKRLLLHYYLRPEYIMSRIYRNKKNVNKINNYIKYGIKLIKNTL
ncbi:MAG: B12-binding domain-containing radical SAM protein [bacterium]